MGDTHRHTDESPALDIGLDSLLFNRALLAWRGAIMARRDRGFALRLRRVPCAGGERGVAWGHWETRRSDCRPVRGRRVQVECGVTRARLTGLCTREGRDVLPMHVRAEEPARKDGPAHCSLLADRRRQSPGRADDVCSFVLNGIPPTHRIEGLV